MSVDDVISETVQLVEDEGLA
eukprot:COSAG05_NODE_5722_length_1107_cov_1.187500_1_plen_20_part_10